LYISKKWRVPGNVTDRSAFSLFSVLGLQASFRDALLSPRTTDNDIEAVMSASRLLSDISAQALNSTEDAQQKT
jgi:hypothetical protein